VGRLVPAGDLRRLAADCSGETDTAPPASTAAAFSVEDPFLFFFPFFVLLDLFETPGSDMQIFVMGLL
jgi:hypothetical protein